MRRLRGDPLLSLQDGRSFLRCTGDVHQGFTGWPVGLATPTSMVPAALPRPKQASEGGQTDTQTSSGTNTMTRRQHQNMSRWIWHARTCRGCPSTMTGCQREGESVRASAPLTVPVDWPIPIAQTNLTPGADRRAGQPIISRDNSRTGVLGAGAGGQQRGTPVSPAAEIHAQPILARYLLCRNELQLSRAPGPRWRPRDEMVRAVPFDPKDGPRSPQTHAFCVPSSRAVPSPCLAVLCRPAGPQLSPPLTPCKGRSDWGNAQAHVLMLISRLGSRILGGTVP